MEPKIRYRERGAPGFGQFIWRLRLKPWWIAIQQPDGTLSYEPGVK
jgi:hypothetical protein